MSVISMSPSAPVSILTSRFCAFSAVQEWTAKKERLQLTKELLGHIHPARAETEGPWRFEGKQGGYLEA